MNVEQAVELGQKAIYHATHRDAGSGGHVQVYHIHKDGWTKYKDMVDVNTLHY
jgi:20S proteasome subunit beta 5